MRGKCLFYNTFFNVMKIVIIYRNGERGGEGMGRGERKGRVQG